MAELVQQYGFEIKSGTAATLDVSGRWNERIPGSNRIFGGDSHLCLILARGCNAYIDVQYTTVAEVSFGVRDSQQIFIGILKDRVATESVRLKITARPCSASKEQRS